MACDNPVQAPDGEHDEAEFEDESRRDLMKKIAAGTGVALTGSLAGCAGGDGGDGGDGGGGDGGGDGGDGGSDGSSGSDGTIGILLAPDALMGITMDYLHEDTSILPDYYEEVGLDVEIDESWEGAAIFTAGGADYESFGSLEAGQIATERDLPLAVNADLVTQFMAVITNEGSEYDVANSGGEQESMDLLVENQGDIGHGGWGGGTPAMLVLAMREAYGYTFSEDPTESDFSIQTAEWFALPQLLDRGDLAATANSPEHGMAAFADEDGNTPFSLIYQIGLKMEEVGLGLPQLNAWTCTQELNEQYPDSSPALVQAYYEGMQWLHEDPIGRIEEDQDHHLDQIGAENMNQAEWMLDVGLELNGEFDVPMVNEEIELTEDFIETDGEFLTTAQEAGYLGETPWEEILEYNIVPQE